MKKNILVVDDSALMRRTICDIINSDTAFQVTDICRDGLEAYERLKKMSYDAVIMDVNMPRMDGLQVLERLQKEQIKATVIVVSSLTTKDAETTIIAMERGAVDFVTKPSNVIEAKGGEFKKNILQVLRAVLRVDSSGPRTIGSTRPIIRTVPQRRSTPVTKTAGKKIVALASSTGGPKALQSVIPKIPSNLKAPIVLVQHMPAGFTQSMSERLNELSNVRVKEAQDGDILRDGWVYVAPGGFHMEIVPTIDGKHKVSLNTKPQVGGLRPYANYMYESLKKTNYDEIVCVVLTGMGSDGTQGIISLSKEKPVHVICQDEKSCVVYGMPKSVVDARMADEVVTLTDVTQSIIKSVGVK